MFKLDLPQDPHEAASIDARRAREAERLKRIMDPRARTMGKDMGALSQQVSLAITCVSAMVEVSCSHTQPLDEVEQHGNVA